MRHIQGVARRRATFDTRRMREYRIVNAAELAAAYARAEYAVLLEGDTMPLRVGEVASDLEAYWPAPRYVFISAWNPASEPRADQVNHDADLALVAQLDALGARRLPGFAQDSEGLWREPGWLVGGLSQPVADLLAREFGQAAVLAWDRGQPVRVRMLLGPAPRQPIEFVDWVE